MVPLMLHGRDGPAPDNIAFSVQRPCEPFMVERMRAMRDHDDGLWNRFAPAIDLIGNPSTVDRKVRVLSAI